YSEPSSNFVAHAGVAVLHVISLGVTRAPKFVEIARQTTRRTHNHIACSRNFVDHPNHGTLTDGRTPVQVVNPIHLRLPGFAQQLDSHRIGGIYMQVAE